MIKNKTVFKKSALSSAILCAIGSAQAAIISVDKNCSLIEAIQTANSDLPVGACVVGNGDDIIQVVTENDQITINTIFESSVAGPGNVGLPIISSHIIIEGNGLTVRADNSTDDFRLFEVGTGGDLTLRDTIVTGADDGFGVGSGLFSYGGRVSIENSTFALNNGGVLLASSFGNEITNSIIRHNINNRNLAGGLQTYFAEVNISNSSFVENEHVSGSYSRGSVNFNIAGGAALFQSEVTIVDSTFSGNTSAYGGGLIISSDTATVFQSKSAQFGNSSLRGMMGSDTQITNSTITNNSALIGAGILDVGDGSLVTLQGSIVSGNKTIASGYAPNIYSTGDSTFNLNANNIIGEKGSTGSINITLGASDRSFSNYAVDNLYPLSLSQGQLLHPLKVGSIAIDGNDLSCFGSVLDQEGKGRGIDGDNNGSFICDVGAFEHSLAIMANGAPCTFVNALESAENDSSIGGCQPGNGHDIIVLPESSSQTFNAVVDEVLSGYYVQPFGIAGIETAVTIESNGSTFSRNPASFENFDLFYVESGGQLNLIDAIVTGANGGLGAVTAWYGGNVNVLNSVITANQSAGIFDVLSINSSVVNSEVSNNIIPSTALSDSFSPLTTVQGIGFELKSSIISGNEGGVGGGVDFRGVSLSTMENSTVSGNSSNAYGGVIMTSGYFNIVPSAKIQNSTITGNTGYVAGGMVTVGNFPGSLIMSHSIVSGNEFVAPPLALPPSNERVSFLGSRLDSSPNRGAGVNEIYLLAPYFTLDSNNIIGQNGDNGSPGITIGASDTVPAGATNTVIETKLADNGGVTLTHLPVAGGLAVDGGEEYCGVREDQTGRIRPWDGDGDGDDNCDIGSVELGSIYASDIIFKDGFDSLIVVRRAPFKD